MSTIPFQPLVKQLTALLDDYAENHAVKIRADGVCAKGYATIGERLFIFHVYDYLSRKDHPLTPGFAHMLKCLTRGRHDRLTHFQERTDGGVHTTQADSRGSHRYIDIAHKLMELEKFNSAIRDANGIKAKEQIVLNLCPECGAVTIGTRYQPSYVCSAACRVAKSRKVRGEDHPLAHVNMRTPEGLKEAIAFGKWLASCHRGVVFDNILAFGMRLSEIFEDELINAIEQLNDAETHAEDQIEDTYKEVLRLIREYTALDIQDLSTKGDEQKFGQFDISLKTSKKLAKRKGEQFDEVASLVDELQELYRIGEDSFFTKSAEKLRAAIRELDPDHPMGYATVNIEPANLETRPRRIMADKGQSLIVLRYAEEEDAWMAVSGDKKTEMEISEEDVIDGPEPEYSLQYKVKSTEYIVPGILDLYDHVRDTEKDVTGDWASACMDVAKRIEVYRVKSSASGSAKIIGPLIDPEHKDRDAKIAFHLHDVLAHITTRLNKALKAEAEASRKYWEQQEQWFEEEAAAFNRIVDASNQAGDAED